MRKKFSLIEVIGVVVIIGILSAIIYNVMKDSPAESAIKSGIDSNIRNYQTVVDRFRMEETKYPTKVQPTLTVPQPLDFEGLYPKYAKTKTPRDGFYWVDGNGRTWGSLLPLVNNVILSEDTVSFDKVEGNEGYNVYKLGGKKSVKGAASTPSNRMEKIGSAITETEFTIPEEHRGAEAYLVSAIDKFGFETAPAGENWITVTDDDLPLTQLKPGTYYFTTNAGEVATWVGWLKDDTVPKGASIHYSFATSNDNKTYSNYSSTFNVGVKAQYMRVKVVLTANTSGDNPKINRLRVMFQPEEIFVSPEVKKPFAIIDMVPGAGVTPDTTVSWSSVRSYSPDGKSIVDSEWKNKQSQYEEGSHTVSLRVKNSAGVWSDWVSKNFDVANPVVKEPEPEPEPEVKKPIAVINYSPNTDLRSDTEITWDSSKSYSLDNLKIVNEEWKNKESLYEVGTHTIELRVQDEKGVWSEWVSQVIRVITPKPIAVINYLPNSALYNDTLITWNSSASYSPQGLEIVDTEWKNKATSYPVGNHQIELRVQDEEGNWSDWAQKGIQVLEKPVVKPIAVIDYIPKTPLRSETVITWNSNKSYSPDGLEITDVEWINKKESYPVGTHIVELRVQNSKGIWSEWTKQTISVSDPVLVKPIAVISYTPPANLTPKTDIEWSHANSYSPDGLTIVASEWKNKFVKYAEGSHTVELRVQNSAGVWSDWKTATIEVKVPKPVAIINYTPNERLYQSSTITWDASKSYSPDKLKIINEEWENKQSTYVVGSHGVSLRVQNSDGVWSDWVSTSIHINEYEKPVAVIEMTPTENLRQHTSITWDASKSYDPNPTPFAIVDTEWENKKSTYPEGEHTVRLRVKNEAGLWSNWTSKRFKVDSDWMTIGKMDYEVDAGTEGDWESVEIEDIQPTDTRMVYEYRSSTNGDIWSAPYKTIGEVPNSRYLKVSIISQRKEHTSAVPTFISILVNYSNDKGQQSTIINKEMNLQLLQEAVDAYFEANNLYPSYSQPKEGTMQAINLNDLYPEYLNVSPENYTDTFWVDHYGQIHTSNKAITFDGTASRIGNMMNGGLFEEKDGLIYYREPNGIGYFYQMNANHLSKKQIMAAYATNITHFGDKIYFSNNGKLFEMDEAGNGVALGIDAFSSHSVRATPDWIYAQNSAGLLQRVRPDGSGKQSYKQVSNYDVVGGWIYYTEYRTGYLKKMKLDGSEDTSLVPISTGMFAVIEDDVYHINNQDAKIYKYNLTTGEKNPISDVKVQRMNISGDWIYYANASDNNSLYKMKLDGSENTQLNSDSSNNIHVLGDWIYYNNISDGYKYYKIRTDGTERSLFEEVFVSENPLGSTDGHINNNNAANSDVNVEGNSNEEWIYYTDTDNKSYWTKMRPDGSEKTAIGNYGIYTTTVVGEKLYYAYNSGLYSANLDLTNSKRIANMNPYKIMVDGDWVYFTVYKGSSTYLYRVLRNGERLSMVTSAKVQDFTVKDGTVYFTNESDNYKVYSIKGNGTENKALYETPSSNIALDGNWLYFAHRQSGGIFKMSLDGSEVSQLSSKQAAYLNASDGSLYYEVTSYEDRGIYKVNQDGTGERRLTRDDARGIDVVGDWLYYSNYTDNNRYYKMKTDGTNRYYIGANPTETPLGSSLQPINKNNATNNALNVEGSMVDGWIYYSDASNGNYWTKIRPDGSEKTLVKNISITNPVIVGDKIYFGYNYGTYVSDLELTDMKVLLNKIPSQLMVDGDFVYVSHYASSRYTLYRVQLDGENYTIVNSENTNKFIVSDNVVYYSNAEDGNKLYRKNGDGTNQIKLTDTHSYYMAIEGNWIYYTNELGYLHKMKLDGTEKTQLNSVNSSHLNVSDGWIYYGAVNTGENGLYKIKTDGTGNQLLAGDTVGGIVVLGDTIYYNNQSDKGVYYKVKTDGTQRYVLESPLTETPLGETSKQVNVHNSGNNIHVDGNLVDGWIYYADTENGNMWTKMLPDGSSKTVLANFTMSNPVIVGDKVYYGYNYGMYVADLDMSNQIRVSNLTPNKIIVDGDWIYFSNYANSRYYLYRVQRDGKNQTKLFNYSISNFIVKDGTVFYTNYQEGNKLYKVNGDGSKPVLLLNESVLQLAIEGDWLYYTNSQSKLHRMKFDGTEQTKLNDVSSQNINISEGWIYYYASTTGQTGLYKMRVDGTGNQLLSSDSVSGIDILGEWIYFSNNLDSNKYYKMKKDGTSRYFIESNPTEKPLGNVAKPVNISNALDTGISVDGNLTDGWVYYSDTKNSNYWTKMLPDGSSKTMVKNTYTYYPVVVGNKVYFSYNNALYSANLDLSDMVRIGTKSASKIMVEDDWVYFTYTYSSKSYLGRVQLDGKNQTMISADTVGNFIVHKGFVYYTDSSDNYKLYKMKGDGTGKTQLTDFAANTFTIDNDMLYVSNSQKGIVKMKLDGSGEVQLSAKYATHINVTDGWIYYYSNTSGSNGLRKMRVDGTGDLLLVNTVVSGIDVLGDWIYYVNQSDRSNHYKIKKDGTGNSPL